MNCCNFAKHLRIPFEPMKRYQNNQNKNVPLKKGNLMDVRFTYVWGSSYSTIKHLMQLFFHVDLL